MIKDLQWPGGRYGHVDHVVVGPSGVYVIDTKTWSGDVSVYGGRLRHEGHTEDSVVASLRGRVGGRPAHARRPAAVVKPVVCVSGAEDLDAQVGALLVCSTDTLVSVLEARVHSMSTRRIPPSPRVSSATTCTTADWSRRPPGIGHSEAKQAKRGDFEPMRGVPVIRIAIACWFTATLVLAPHVFTDTYNTIHDEVQLQIAKH